MSRFFGSGGGYGFGMSLGKHPKVGHLWRQPRYSDGAVSHVQVKRLLERAAKESRTRSMTSLQTALRLSIR
jgi:hypothetical protein